MDSKTESQVAAWCAWTKTRYNWSEQFAKEQAMSYLKGERGVVLHDVTAAHFSLFLNLP